MNDSKIDSVKNFTNSKMYSTNNGSLKISNIIDQRNKT